MSYTEGSGLPLADYKEPGVKGLGLREGRIFKAGRENAEMFYTEGSSLLLPDLADYWRQKERRRCTMAECECMGGCPFFSDKMANMPAMAAGFKKRYCSVGPGKAVIAAG
jgi:hypothetical protein